MRRKVSLVLEKDVTCKLEQLGRRQAIRAIADLRDRVEPVATSEVVATA